MKNLSFLVVYSILLLILFQNQYFFDENLKNKTLKSINGVKGFLTL